MNRYRVITDTPVVLREEFIVEATDAYAAEQNLLCALSKPDPEDYEYVERGQTTVLATARLDADAE